MSHYCCAVFSKHIDDSYFHDLLDPFCEDRHMEKCYVVESEVMQQWSKYQKYNPKHKFEDFLKNYGYTEEIPGKYYYMSNPHGHYDYYSLDGKCYYEMPKPFQKPDESYGRYKKSQLMNGGSFIKIKNLIHAIKMWKSIQDCDFYSDEYKKDNKNLLRFIKEYTGDFIPYCFITPDGKWVSPGQIGWFGASSETHASMSTYLKEWKQFWKYGEDCYVSFCDLHI